MSLFPVAKTLNNKYAIKDIISYDTVNKRLVSIKIEDIAKTDNILGIVKYNNRIRAYTGQCSLPIFNDMKRYKKNEKVANYILIKKMLSSSGLWYELVDMNGNTIKVDDQQLQEMIVSGVIIAGATIRRGKLIIHKMAELEILN